MGTFDAALLRFVAVMASATLHGVVLAALLFAEPPPEREVVRVEIVSPPPAAPAGDDDETTLEPPPPAAEPTAPPTAPAPATDAPRNYREVLAERERAFAADMEARAQRLSALDVWRDTDGPADSEEVAVRLCGARALERPLRVTRERDMSRYASFVPTGLFPTAYTAGMTQVIERDGGRALGRLEFALPARAATVQLDDPKGTIFSVGREDARCLIGLSWDPEEVFPLRFTHVPARWIALDDRVHEVLLDVQVLVDGSFTFDVRGGDALPFDRGVLYDQKTVARNLAQHAAGARVVHGVMESLFGG